MSTFGLYMEIEFGFVLIYGQRQRQRKSKPELCSQLNTTVVESKR